MRLRAEFALCRWEMCRWEMCRWEMCRWEMCRWVLAAAFVVFAGGSVLAVEIGDADGDGRLSLADAVHLQRLLPAAEGALDGYLIWLSCERSSADVAINDPYRSLGGITYLEGLRRALDSAVPHWDPYWPFEPGADPVVPLDPDDRFQVELLSATGPEPGSDRVLIDLRLTVFESVRAFSLVIDPEPGMAASSSRCPSTRPDARFAFRTRGGGRPLLSFGRFRAAIFRVRPRCTRR